MVCVYIQITFRATWTAENFDKCLVAINTTLFSNREVLESGDAQTQF